MSKSVVVAKRTYGLAEVASAIGIQRGTLHSWLARYHIPVETPGRGVERHFSFEMVVWLAAVAAMTRQGIEITQAAKFLNAVAQDFRRAIRHDDGHGVVLLVEGNKPRIGNRQSLQPWLNSWDGPYDDGRPETASVLLLGPLIKRIRKALDAQADAPRAA
jgi:hypothetical protein